MVTEGIEPSTVALLAQRSNQLSYATSLLALTTSKQYTPSLSLNSQFLDLTYKIKLKFIKKIISEGCLLLCFQGISSRESELD